MVVRDRLVAIVLALGVLLGMAAWQAVTPWLGVVIVLGAVFAASVVYRLDVGRGPKRSAPDVECEVSRPRPVAERP